MTSSSSLYGTVTQQNTSSANSTGLYGDANTPIPDASGNLVVRGDLYVLSGNILTTANTGNLFPTNATTVNVGLAATAVNIGSATGDTTVNNNLVVEGNLTTNGTFIAPSADFGNIQIAVVDGQTISTSAGELRLRSTSGAIKLPSVTSIYTDNTSSFGVLNQPTTVNAFLAATTLNIGASSGTTNINNNLLAEGTGTFTGDITAPGGTLGNISVGVINNNTIDNATGAITISSGANSIVLDSEYISNPNANAYLFNSPTTVIAFDSATTLNLGDVTGTTFIRNDVTVGGDLKINGNDIKSNGGTTAITLSGNDVTIADDLTVNGNNINLAQDTLIGYSENNDRLNRPTVRSTTGNTSGFRVEAPNATTSALSSIAAFSTNDPDNGKFINISARGAATSDLRIQTGKYTAGVLGASGTVVSFVDNVTTYATVNPAGPTNPLDLATKAYVDAQELNTTYTIDATATTGGANLNLVGSDATTDTIKFAQGTGITVSRTDANTITITNTAPDTNTTYTQNISATTGGANLNLVGSDATTDTVKFADGTGVTVSYTDASTATIAIGQAVGTTDNVQFNSVTTPTINANGGFSFVNTAPMGGTYATVNQFGPFNGTDLTTVDYVNSVLPTVVTYTQDASATTGGANVNLVGSNSTTDTIKYAGAGSVSVVATDASTVTITGTDTNTTYTVDATSTTGGANLNLVGSDATTDSVAYLGSGATTVTRTDANTITISSTDNNTTYTQDVSSTTGGANLNLVGSDATTDSVKFAGGTNVTVVATDASTMTINATDTNTTYTIDASSTTGGANLNLVGSDASTDTVKIASGTAITVSQTDANTITIDNAGVTSLAAGTGIGVSGSTGGVTVSNTGVTALAGSNHISVDASTGSITVTSDATNANTAGTIVARNGNGDFSAGTITANFANGDRVLGALTATPSTTYTFQAPVLTTINDNNGLDAVSSYTGTLGNGAQQQITQYFGDTFAANLTSAALGLRTANGNSETTGTVPFTGLAPTAANASILNNTLGTINYAGYATTDFANYISTRNQGGGRQATHNLQIQGVANETYADGTLTISGATITAVSRVSVALASVSVTGTKGQISFTATTPGVGNAIVVTGTNSGTSTGITAGTYYITQTASTTTAQLSATPGGPPITTTAGTTTGLTFTRQFITVTYSAQTYIPFGLNALVTISGFNNVTSGTYMAVGTSTTTSINIGAPSSAVPTLSGSQSVSCPTVTNAGSSLRIRAMPLAKPMNTGNRVDIITHSPETATYKSDQYNFQGGSNTFNFLTANAAAVTAQGSFVVKDLTGATTYATVDVAKAAFTVPVGFPVKTAAQWRAITGAVGYQVCVSDSAAGSNPNGMMAFWDTTNARWSYIHDNSAV